MPATPTLNARSEVLALAKKLGAKVEFTPGKRAPDRWGRAIDAELTVEAPEGHHWAGDDIHELVHQAPYGDNSLWADALERMKPGLASCTGECEWWS
jgi:hypothetical protein